MVAAGLLLAASGCLPGATRNTLEAAERAASPEAVASSLLSNEESAGARRGRGAADGSAGGEARRAGDGGARDGEAAGGRGTRPTEGRERAASGGRTASGERTVSSERAGEGGRPREAHIPDDAALEREVDLASLQAAAIARHPQVAAAAQRVRATAMDARAEGSLPSPELMAELWQVPLARPWAVPDAGMLMFSVRQEIPAAGSLDRAAQAMALEAQAGAAMVTGAALEIARDVGRAFAMYVEATARHRAHGEHVGIFEQMSAAARARYTAGGPVSDLVKADLERARLLSSVAREQGRLEEARATLNVLLSRAVDAPLGPPREGEPMGTKLTPAEAAERAMARSPAVAAAEAMKGAAAQRAEAAGREASYPSFLVGLSYFHPVGGMHAGWGATVGMSLPWVWGPGSKRAEGATARARGEASAAQAVRLQARGGAATAVIAVQEAGRRLLALRNEALPVAQRALEVTRAGYAAGGSDFLMWLDAAHATLEVELEITEAQGDLERALVELDFAVGGRAARSPLPLVALAPAHGAAGGAR
ncbi:TolC family protein [Chondromyces crocatus]|nr:TolC family protein [Chondromyces crocatus]